MTYDDGPSSNTETILDALEKVDGCATFFVVGYLVKSHASYVKRAYRMGCEIGNHTWKHQNLTSLSSAAINKTISDTNNSVKKVTGKAPVLTRPPYGSKNSSVASAVNMPLILWSIDTLDWKTRNTNSTVSAIKSKVKDGDIILMHDLYAQTAAASKIIIPYLDAQGYQLVTVTELSIIKKKPLKKTKSYSSIR